MPNPRTSAPLRPHTPASLAPPGAVRPGVAAKKAPRGRARGPGPRPSPAAVSAGPDTGSRVRVRRPRSLGPQPPPVQAAPLAQLPAQAGAPAPAPAPARGPSLADQLGQKVYVADLQGATYDLCIEPNKTCFFDTINKVKALTVAGPTSLCVDESLARARGYDPEDLLAIAEIAWHYLMSGGLKLALTLYEGLAAVAPEEPYFALALGLTFDRLNDPAQADAAYRRASQLDPKDGRPDINRAELRLEAGDRAQAMKLLARGSAKANRAGDRALANKADALLEHLMRR